MPCTRQEPAEGTWDPHALKVWHLGLAWKSYRCHTVCIPSTCGAHSTNTLTWLPTKHTMPVATPADLMQAATKDMRDALNSSDENAFISNLPQTQTELLKELTEALTNIANTTNPEPCEPTISKPLVKCCQPQHHKVRRKPAACQPTEHPFTEGDRECASSEGGSPQRPSSDRGWGSQPMRLLLRGWQNQPSNKRADAAETERNTSSTKQRPT